MPTQHYDTYGRPTSPCREAQENPTPEPYRKTHLFGAWALFVLAILLFAAAIVFGSGKLAGLGGLASGVTIVAGVTYGFRYLD